MWAYFDAKLKMVSIICGDKSDVQSSWWRGWPDGAGTSGWPGWHPAPGALHNWALHNSALYRTVIYRRVHCRQSSREQCNVEQCSIWQWCTCSTEQGSTGQVRERDGSVVSEMQKLTHEQCLCNIFPSCAVLLQIHFCHNLRTFMVSNLACIKHFLSVCLGSLNM